MTGDIRHAQGTAGQERGCGVRGQGCKFCPCKWRKRENSFSYKELLTKSLTISTARVGCKSFLLLQALVWSAAQIPAPVIVPGFRKKPLHKSTRRIPHSSCLTPLLSREKSQTAPNQTYSAPKLWQETAPCVSTEMEGLQCLSPALTAGLPGCRYVGNVFMERFLSKPELWVPIPCPLCSRQANCPWRSGPSLSYLLLSCRGQVGKGSCSVFSGTLLRLWAGNKWRKTHRPQLTNIKTTFLRQLWPRKSVVSPCIPTEGLDTGHCSTMNGKA